MNRLIPQLLLALALLSFTGVSRAEAIRVAVASNFADAIRDIAQQFEEKTQHKVTLIVGSTGKHYAQIKHGAPFDAFFAADVKRPELLEQEDLIQAESRFTYAIGKVVLWSPYAKTVDAKAEVLQQADFQHLSIANPKLAPYGRAAQQILQAQGVWDKLQKQMVRGENVGQAFQFVKSGNAELGFVAYSQVKQADAAMQGSLWEPPIELYTPIEQQAVLLKDNAVARDFLAFVQTEAMLQLIQDYGYATP